MLMVGAVVLFYGANVLKMGVLVGFMHDNRSHKAQIDVKTVFYPCAMHWITFYSSEKTAQGTFFGARGCFCNTPEPIYPSASQFS